MRKTILPLVLAMAAAAVAANAAQPDLSKLPPASDRQGLTYEKDIKPLFEASCVRCHSGDKPKGGLRLDSLQDAIKGGKEGKVINPGDGQKSPLVIAVARLDPDTAMPPTFKPGQGPGPGGMRPGGGGPGGPPPGNAGAPQGGPGPGGRGPGGPGAFGPPPKPLTPEQVGLVRAWVQQGAN